MTGHAEGGTFPQRPGWSLRRSHREMTLTLFSGFWGFLGARPAGASLRAACGRGRPPRAPSLPSVTSLQGRTRAGPHPEPLRGWFQGHQHPGAVPSASDILSFPRDPVVQNQSATREERASIFQGTNSSTCLFEFAVTLAGLRRHTHCARGRGPRTWLHRRNVPSSAVAA